MIVVRPYRLDTLPWASGLVSQTGGHLILVPGGLRLVRYVDRQDFDGTSNRTYGLQDRRSPLVSHLTDIHQQAPLISQLSHLRTRIRIRLDVTVHRGGLDRILYRRIHVWSTLPYGVDDRFPVDR